MNVPIASHKLRSSAREMTKLKAWRKRQLVEDGPNGSRAMRITDVPRLYGIPWQTWHAWEQPPGHKDFKCPNPENMRRLCVEITKGAVQPEDFYPVDSWRATLGDAARESLSGG